MKKVIMFVKILSVTFTLLLAVGIIWNITEPEKDITTANITEETAIESILTASEIFVPIADEEETETETEAETETESIDSALEITQIDIQTQETKLQMLIEQEAEIQAKLEFYQSLPETLSEEERKEIMQHRILKYYEENVLLALEAKTLLMGSLGVPIPSEFNAAKATDDYEAYLLDELTGELVGQIGSEEVQSAVRYGIDGAIESYREDGSLTAALGSAVDSVVEGVVADIQSYPYEYAKGILDETTGGLYSIAEGLLSSDSLEDFLENTADDMTGGLVGTIEGIFDYDDSATTAAYFQGVAQNASDSAAKLESLLDKETINSEDIANMIYQYAQFGHAMNRINGYEWESNYNNMQIVYTKFVQNEIMIDMLSDKMEEVVHEENQ